MTANTSATLLDRLKNPGDALAWDRLVELYLPLIRSWLLRHGASEHEAEDLAQEALLVVVRRVPSFVHNGRPGAFRSWLRSITTNCIRRSWRTRRTSPPEGRWSDLATVLDRLADPSSELSQAWNREHDEHVLASLLAIVESEFRPTTWQAFRRVVLDEQSPELVARELALSVNAVLIAKSRVLRRLRLDSAGLLD